MPEAGQVASTMTLPHADLGHVRGRERDYDLVAHSLQEHLPFKRKHTAFLGRLE
jgi:hypothetical protein